MEREENEIHQGDIEVFNNNNTIPTLKNIISNSQSNLDNLMSIKVVKNRDNIVYQYNIETKKYITKITTNQGLDLLLTQYNKEKQTDEIYSPYSNPGYNFFAYLLLAYYEVYKKRPNIDFSDIDIQARNEERNGLGTPMIEFVKDIRWEGNIFPYLQYKEFFKTDSDGINRIVIPKEEETGKNDREGFGIKGDSTILHFPKISSLDMGNSNSSFEIENNLIPVYLQAFIDTNRRKAGSLNATNLKKIYEMMYYLLENEDVKKRFNFSEIRNNTPMIEPTK